MRRITHNSAARQARRVLLTFGVGLTLAATPALAAPAPATSNCSANATGIAYSEGAASGASPSACPVANGRGSGDVTGHKVG
jgi:hypothetical protein